MNSKPNDLPFHERHDDELLTLEDVAQILKTSENTVRWWRQTGTDPEFFKIGRRLYTTVGDLRRSSARSGSRPGHRQAEGGVRAMDDPRHVFLSASDVMARYGWGKTKGYQNLKDRELVPPPVMTHPDRWRLDQLLAWEERRMALAEAALESLLQPDRRPETVTDLLPQPKRRRRTA
jgi:predicted DNA-binding transcriptional regulator AlpA